MIKHTIKIGALVELIHHGERLYVTDLTNDCDGTALYNLGIHGSDIIYRGFHAECLEVVKENK